MKFIKEYWFSILIGLWLTLFLLMLTLVLLAPKYDLQNRGFTYCTQKLIEDIQDCDAEFFCGAKAVSSSTWCDVKIIAQGIKLWYNNEQPRPWSNYIFTPETASVFDDEELAIEAEGADSDVAPMQELIKIGKDTDYAASKD